MEPTCFSPFLDAPKMTIFKGFPFGYIFEYKDIASMVQWRSRRQFHHNIAWFGSHT